VKTYNAQDSHRKYENDGNISQPDTGILPDEVSYHKKNLQSLLASQQKNLKIR